MIPYNKFKEIFDNINYEAEITLTFNNKVDTYMIIKYDNFITFQRIGKNMSGEIKFKSLEELYNTKTIDNIYLLEDWKNVADIVFDDTFSVKNDKDYFFEQYNIKL